MQRIAEEAEHRMRGKLPVEPVSAVGGEVEGVALAGGSDDAQLRPRRVRPRELVRDDLAQTHLEPQGSAAAPVVSRPHETLRVKTRDAAAWLTLKPRSRLAEQRLVALAWASGTGTAGVGGTVGTPGRAAAQRGRGPR